VNSGKLKTIRGVDKIKLDFRAVVSVGAGGAVVGSGRE